MRPSTGSRTATVGLLVGNAVPLVGVLAFDWSAAVLLVVYWLESGVVGASFLVKILRARGVDDPATLPNIRFNERSVASFVGEPNRSVAEFFASHYGVFWLVHGAFVGVLSGMPTSGPVEVVPIAVSFVALAAYHAVSYWRHFAVGDEASRRGPVTLMVEPYRRVFVLHLTVIFGMFGVMSLGAPAALVAVLVLVKTILDLRGHWREHGDDGKSGDAPSPT
jgi:hypothetical protein